MSGLTSGPTSEPMSGLVAAPAGVPADTLDDLITVRPPTGRPNSDPTWDEASVVLHEVLDGHYHRLVLHSPSIASSAWAGQFVMISVPSSGVPAISVPSSGVPANPVPSQGRAPILLPRPMAIQRRHPERGDIEVTFSIAGRGTAELARIEVGQSLLLIGPLGRGFEIPDTTSRILVMAHGSGVCAVLGIVEDAAARGIPTLALLSAAMRSAVVGERDCAELGTEAIIVTEDAGSNTIPAIDRLLREHYRAERPSVIMVCGSSALTRAAVALGVDWGIPVQVALEAHMACGLGYCHGCAAPVAASSDRASSDGATSDRVTSDGAISDGATSDREGPLVCRDGPVFDAHVPH